MAILRNLALTPREMGLVRPLPPAPAWMSCHFAEEGLRDLPAALPPHSLLILDDSTPLGSSTPAEICNILKTAHSRVPFDGLLLDFQRDYEKKYADLAGFLSENLPCPVAVSEAYGDSVKGPVLLSMPAPHQALPELIRPWRSRELWLELGMGPETAVVTETGTVFSPFTGKLPDCPLHHKGLHCHYSIVTGENQICFTLVRTREDLQDLEAQAEALGITRTLGLYQELGPMINETALH